MMILLLLLYPYLYDSFKFPLNSLSKIKKTYLSMQVKETGSWMPIGSSAAFEKIQPLQIEVLGERLVVWEAGAEDCEIEVMQDGNIKRVCTLGTRWTVMKDICSHRLAPLSQGRVDPETGCIECPYHGWQFDGEGTCTKIPQLEPIKKGIIPKLANKESYPVEVVGDLIWAFLPLPPGQASFFPKSPKEMFPELLERPFWTSRELPYSFDFLLENFMDPAQ
jgi:phenylpropionate dioxygenase-like ring-hydroxylating dioxygenase large terminal subunit